jgi:predicted Zn-dependent protease
LSLKPGNPMMLWSYGWALLNLDHPAEAMKVWQESAAKEENLNLSEDPLLWTTYTFALGYWAMGDKEAAFKAYTQADSSRTSDVRATFRCVEASAGEWVTEAPFQD